MLNITEAFIFMLHCRCEDTSSLLSPLILKSYEGSMREYSLTGKDMS